MIFCFSGTGNSGHVAEKVHERFGGELYNIAECLRNGETDFRFEAEEKAVFVFPVYFDSVPEPVRLFLNRFRIASGHPDIIGIATCGGSIGGTDRVFRSLLRRKGLDVRAFYDVVMPDNCIFWLNTPIREKALMILKHSEDRIRDILDAMQYNYRMPYESSAMAGAGSRFGDAVGRRLMGTGPFYADEHCTGCGACAAVCPCRAIEIREGRPVWVKSRCWKCTACINRCPQAAIQYGRMTRKRFRYVHPDLGKPGPVRR